MCCSWIWWGMAITYLHYNQFFYFPFLFFVGPQWYYIKTNIFCVIQSILTTLLVKDERKNVKRKKNVQCYSYRSISITWRHGCQFSLKFQIVIIFYTVVHNALFAFVCMQGHFHSIAFHQDNAKNACNQNELKYFVALVSFIFISFWDC